MSRYLEFYKVYMGDNPDGDDYELCRTTSPRAAAQIAQDARADDKPVPEIFHVVKLVQPDSGKGLIYEPNSDGVRIDLVRDTERKFLLMGDIAHAGRVRVRACTPAEAVVKAEAGDFEIYEEQGSQCGFKFDGGVEHIEEETDG